MPDPTDAAFLLVLGLSGGLHCAAMCGPLACSYAIPARGAARLRTHGAYYAGRFLAYGLIGALLGALGGAVLAALEPGGGFRLAGKWAAGLVMIGGGVAVLAGAGLPPRAARLLDRLHAPLIAALRALAPRFPSPGSAPGSAWRVLPLGMVSGVVPCGLMWVAELKAAVSGSATAGLLLMTLFCAATSPSLLVTGRLASWLAPARRRMVVRLSGVVIIAMAVHLLFLHDPGSQTLPGTGHG